MDPLILAIQKGDLKEVQQLVEQGADIHAGRDRALHYAIGGKHWDIARFLLQKGANIELWSSITSNSQIIIGSNDLKFIEAYLDRLDNIYLGIIDGLIYTAAENKRLDIVQLITSKKKGYYNIDDALKAAVGISSLPIVQFLFQEGGNPDELFPNAVRGQNLAIIEFLLEKGANPTLGLNAAVDKGDLKMVQLLIDKGANANANANANEWHIDYPLLDAVSNGDLKMVQLLLDNKADPNIDDGRAILIAVEKGYIGIIRALVAKGADVRVGNNHVLRFAAQQGYREIVELALDKGADIHSEEDHAVRVAIQNRHWDVLELLLNRGADVHAKNDKALYMAITIGHMPAIQMLLDKGAKVEEKSLRAAIESQNVELVRLLLEKGADPTKVLSSAIHVQRGGFITTHDLNRSLDIIDLLLDAGADVHANDEAALRKAAEPGFHVFIEELLEAGADASVLGFEPSFQTVDPEPEPDPDQEPEPDPETNPAGAFMADFIRKLEATEAKAKPLPRNKTEVIRYPYYELEGKGNLKKELNLFRIVPPTKYDPFWYFEDPEPEGTVYPDRDYVINGIEFTSTEVKFFNNTAFEYPLLSEGPYEFDNLSIEELRKIKDFLNGRIDIDEISKLTNEHLLLNKSLLHWSKLKYVRKSLRESFDLGVPFFSQRLVGIDNPVMQRVIKIFF